MALLLQTKPAAGPLRAGLRVHVLLVLVALVAPGLASAKVLMTTAEALGHAFPGCTTTRRTLYPTPEQQADIARRAGAPFDRAIIYLYQADCGETGDGGVLLFDTHRVRTLEETLAIAINVDHTVRRVDVVSFREPEEYLLPEVWFNQFTGKALTADLAIGKSIRNMTGASLSSRAAEAAIRRALAIVAVLGVTR
ncbi:MAG: FMN-binding protein [Candidatus Dadabacteria bacterium]|nr:MAG: FMN-binding protein [Candidatus Dadabacteria bacterium]